ncbi:ATP-binding cassette sub- B member 6, mitochondrial [Globomyces sp. JEL0801]|nr:ATP-binding cassette sub- B member 6, mitochondrial [Globomyces sp. JEL0801]
MSQNSIHFSLILDDSLYPKFYFYWLASCSLLSLSGVFLLANVIKDPHPIDIISVVFTGIQIIALVVLLYLTQRYRRLGLNSSSETEPLLTEGPATSHSRQSSHNPNGTDPHTPKPTFRQKISTGCAKLRKLVPFLWPKGLKLQLLVLACFTLLSFGRVINMLVPYTYKLLIDELNTLPTNHTINSLSNSPLHVQLTHTLYNTSATSHPLLWITILFYTLFRFLQGGNISCGFRLANIPPAKSAWTGEVLRVMDRGTSSIGSLLSYLLFNILPVFVDIGLAVIYLAVLYDWTISLIVLTTMILYIFFTITVTEWRTRFRREMNELDTFSRGRAVDSLLNFETVKYFGNEAWEVQQYKEAFLEYQKADWKSSASLNLLNTAQNLVITLGLLSGLLLCAKRVQDGVLTVGDFVGFGTYYRVIQQNFIDMEKMLDLFDVDQTILDSPNAYPLPFESGHIRFNHVSFAYGAGDTMVLDDVDFEIKPGQTCAVVGQTGGGKSTLLRLLFRFFDIGSECGSITIDGHDIRNVTQKSLRHHMGVVPQDTVLFNDTIMFNIRYGDVTATDEQVIEAAKRAQIHDTIMAFPQGYATKVGERGLRLSGGEKQRVAIARTILKNPSIIILDEATSSLDNQTEKQVQNTLDSIFQDRTRIIVAHRLSTIQNADVILVLEGGRLVERGNHDELVSKRGVYYRLWTRQIEDDGSVKRSFGNGVATFHGHHGKKYH